MQMRIDSKSCIIYHNKIYTSSDIKRRTEQIAATINKYDLSEKRALICLERTPDLLCTVLATLKMGVTYIPISIDTPQYRMDYIVKSSHADVVITNIERANLFNGISKIFIENINETESVFGQDEERVNRDDPAYIIYTSGTTGTPKGVEISYGALWSFIDSFTERIPFKYTDTIVFLTDISFDISFVETVVAIMNGLTIVMADDAEQRNPRKLCSLIQNSNATILQMTPSRVRLLSEIDRELCCLQNVQKLLIGGEVFPQNLLNSLQQNTTAAIYNLYGPTETTIWATVADLSQKEKVDIGQPLSNSKIYIVDEHLNSVNNGEVGEIIIAGNGVASKYVDDPILTMQKFIESPFQAGEILYKTGDLGKVDNEGNIEYVGRKDNQIKLNGYRIELEEIEFILNECPKIEQAVVVFDKGMLIALYKEKENVSPVDLQRYMQERTPAYMIPSRMEKIEKFVYKTNGKLDRKETYNNYIMEQEQVRKCEIEQRVLDIINSNLHINSFVRKEDMLSNIGLDSLSFIKILVGIEDLFGFRFEDERLNREAFDSVNSLITYVQEKSKDWKLRDEKYM